MLQIKKCSLLQRDKGAIQGHAASSQEAGFQSGSETQNPFLVNAFMDVYVYDTMLVCVYVYVCIYTFTIFIFSINFLNT